ncbi:LysR family substrate-binding domain-containing protein [Nocardioides alcanivorans]|uniref:LysR family substrate-binding domain-containing protein n=1 Tax=Nocardioides alcanivorans TaxID=2897352 RepID=UPI001F2E7817|nr:LysR family substrate-binding domain-containing protein [Nocardioides alcanivorans]
MNPSQPGLRIGFVPGATPDKWAARWREQFPRVPLELVPVEVADQERLLREGALDMCLARVPVDRDLHHAIPLYDEVPVAVVPKEHPATAYDEVSLADLADEQLIQDPAEVPGWAEVATAERLAWPPMTIGDAVEVVASGTGIVIVPMSIARLHHRKDVAQVPVTDGPVSSVVLLWLRERDDEWTQRFVGIVRGRTARSSRH